MVDKVTDDIDEVPEEELVSEIVTVKDREIVIRQLNSIQFMQLQHEASIMEKGDSSIRMRKAMDRCYRILRSSFVNDEEREYVEDLIADGEFDMKQLSTLVIKVTRTANKEQESRNKNQIRRTPVRRR